MLTNLIAGIIVTLSTNAVETDNAVSYSYSTGNVLTSIPPQDDRRSHIVTPATEKYKTETVTEKRSLEFEIEGKKFNELLSERIVSSTTRTYKLKQEWVEAGVKTNKVATEITSIDTPAGLVTITDAVFTADRSWDEVVKQIGNKRKINEQP